MISISQLRYMISIIVRKLIVRHLICFKNSVSVEYLTLVD